MNTQAKLTPTNTATSDCCLNNSAIQENEYISMNSSNGAIKIRYFGFIIIFYILKKSINLCLLVSISPKLAFNPGL